MLTHPTFDQLRALKLTGMLKALQEQEQMPDIGCLGFLERVGLLVDREIAERDSRRLADRLDDLVGHPDARRAELAAQIGEPRHVEAGEVREIDRRRALQAPDERLHRLGLAFLGRDHVWYPCGSSRTPGPIVLDTVTERT